MTENFGAKAIREMASDDLNKLKLELAQHAGYIRMLYFWRTRDPNDLPEGETIGSIVSLAIEKLMTGDWNWDPAKYPDLKKYLKMQIKNLLGDLSVKKDNTFFTSPPGEESAEFASWHSGSEKRDPTADWMARHDPTPEESLLAKVRRQQEQEALELLKEEAKDDPNALLYILAAGQSPYNVRNLMVLRSGF